MEQINTETTKAVEELRRLIEAANALPKTDAAKDQWVRLIALLTEYINNQMPLIEANKSLTKKWLLAGVALQVFLTELLEVKKKEINKYENGNR